MTPILINKSLPCATAILVVLTFSAVSGQIRQQKANEPIQSDTLAKEKPEASANRSAVAGNSTSGQFTKWTGRNTPNRGVVTAKPDNARPTGNRTSPSGLSVAAAPAQQPVSLTPGGGLVFAGFNEVDGVTPYTVPQGQLLVIQHLAATVDNDHSVSRCSAYVVVDPASATPMVLPILLTEQTNYPPAIGNGTSFGGSQQVTIYLHAGQIVQFGGSRSDFSGVSAFSWFLYGYLVPAP